MKMKFTMKENKTLIWVVVGVIVVLAIWYFASGMPNTSYTPPTSYVPDTTTNTGAKAPAATPGKGSGAGTSAPAPVAPGAKIAGVGPLKNLFDLKQDLSCNVQTTDAATKRSGTLYVSGGEARGDFTSTVSGVKLSSSMIDDGTNLYAWMSDGTTGLKASAAASASGSAIALRGGIDPAANISYSCYPWEANTSLFIPPTSITFTDSSGH